MCIIVSVLRRPRFWEYYPLRILVSLPWTDQYFENIIILHWGGHNLRVFISLHWGDHSFENIIIPALRGPWFWEYYYPCTEGTMALRVLLLSMYLRDSRFDSCWWSVASYELINYFFFKIIYPVFGDDSLGATYMKCSYSRLSITHILIQFILTFQWNNNTNQ